jgi:hypothetical protein
MSAIIIKVSIKKSGTYSFLFHIDDKSPAMKYADAKEVDILGTDLLRYLRCMYIASCCGNQCFKMISEEYLESKVGLKIAGIERK